MPTPDPRHDLYESLTVILARTALEQRRLQRGNVDCARTAAVLEEITAEVQDLAGQIERLDGQAPNAGASTIRVIVAN